MATTDLMKVEITDIEQVLINGDLSKLSPPQRLEYYQRVCSSLGLNPLTKPFDYIMLNGKLTLYAKKDAADQLRSIKGVSIDDVDIQEVGDNYIVKVKGHDKTGRTDVEIGAVSKKDMQGNLANIQMKAVTKGKRRLTLSLCGLGMLDETEIETIRDAKPVIVKETGEIITTQLPGNNWQPAEVLDQMPLEDEQKKEPSAEITGTITPQMLVDLKLSEDVASAAKIINKLHIGGKDASTHLVIMRKYRAAKDEGKSTDEAVAEALA